MLLLGLCRTECTHLHIHQYPKPLVVYESDHTSMADTRVVYFYPNLVGLGWSHLDILN